jgi:hypothetical protein
LFCVLGVVIQTILDIYIYIYIYINIIKQESLLELKGVLKALIQQQENRIGDVMVSMLASSAVDRVRDPPSGQTKAHGIKANKQSQVGSE